MRTNPATAACAAILGVGAGCATGSVPSYSAENARSAIVLVEDRGSGDQLGNPLPLRVPIRGVMAGIIDFSATGVVEIASSETPLTDDDWLAAGLAAINLVGASTLITLPGSGPHDADWVAQPEWRHWAAAMQAASISTGTAAKRKDRRALDTAAAKLITTCQSCHEQFQIIVPETPSNFANQSWGREAVSTRNSARGS